MTLILRSAYFMCDLFYGFIPVKVSGFWTNQARFDPELSLAIMNWGKSRNESSSGIQSKNANSPQDIGIIRKLSVEDVFKRQKKVSITIPKTVGSISNFICLKLPSSAFEMYYTVIYRNIKTVALNALVSYTHFTLKRRSKARSGWQLKNVDWKKQKQASPAAENRRARRTRSVLIDQTFLQHQSIIIRPLRQSTKMIILLNQISETESLGEMKQFCTSATTTVAWTKMNHRRRRHADEQI